MIKQLLFFFSLIIIITSCAESKFNSENHAFKTDTLIYKPNLLNKPLYILYTYNHQYLKNIINEPKDIILHYLFDSNPYFVFEHFRRSYEKSNMYFFDCCNHFYLNKKKTDLIVIGFLGIYKDGAIERIKFKNNFLKPYRNDTFVDTVVLNRYPSNLKSPHFFNDYTKEDSLRLIDHVEFFKSSLVRDTVLLEYNNYTQILDKKTKVLTKVMYIKRNLKVNEVANARKEYRNAHKITFLLDGFSFNDW